MNYSNPQNSDFNYEETVAKIETIIARIESGELTIEQVFDKFGVAVEDLQKCEEFLAQGQQQMNLAIETLEHEF